MTRVAVAVPMWAGDARPLIRAGAAFAGKLNAPWVAITVHDRAHELSRLSEEEAERVRENTQLVSSLGGTPFFCEGDDLPETLLAAAAVARADILMLGKPLRRSRLQQLFRRQSHMTLMFCGVS